MIKARLATEVGTRVSLRVYWGDDCSNCGGSGSKGYHNAHTKLYDSPEKMNGIDPEGNITYNSFGGKVEDYPAEQFPIKCDHCDASVPTDANRQVFNERLYDTPSGKLEPGCLYWAHWYPENMYWDNHKGHMLFAVLPGGGHWNIDSRASNCAKPDDRNHRCWIRHGEPPNIHVDCLGPWCGAGGGSIAYGHPGEKSYYHGFLQNGHFTDSV